MATKIYKFTVEGFGPIPADMLRYDSAWPADQQAATDMDQSFRPENRAKVNHIALKCLEPPTARRRESFGWKTANVTRVS